MAKDKRILYLTLLIMLMLAISYFLVWQTGGTSKAFPHIFYIPIIFTAVFLPIKYSLVTAVLSGILLSEWLMPLSHEPLTYQATYNWLFRLLSFVMISLWTSLLLKYYSYHSRKLQAQATELAQLHKATVHALIDLAEIHDKEVTGKHLNRLEFYASLVSDYLQLDDELKANISDTIGLHDIGKVSVPDHILNKPGPLNSEEWQVIKQHPTLGATILDAINERVKLTNPSAKKYLETAKDIVLYHHEKWNGTGYPQGLKGKRIPLSARITALCDVYDSLRSQRPYKKAYSHTEAVEIILESDGTHFDPQIIAAFKELEADFDQVWQTHSPKNGS